MKYSLIAGALSLLALSAQADTLTLGYSGFYKHLDTVADAGTEQATLGFYLSRHDGKGLCTINSGIVEMEGQQKAVVEVLPHGEFVLPYDKQLDTDKAVVKLDVTSPVQCDISIQIQSVLPAGMTDAAQLRYVRDEMTTLLKEMAGWPGRYFVPDVKGIQLQPLVKEQSIEGLSRLTLDNAALAGRGQWQLPNTLVTPWL
ncbi:MULTISPECIES: DUF2987 domain-containing protein [Oceanimonas]|uniref:DUF2987 domain-containing protein n=1 Tax=Oceanimonas smirnovii TaxID=264574 RepID=A0ABW7P1E1_9GAMM|nr:MULTISPECIES: DUF2987 domain-containing protein [Oceanimonas]MDV2856929.1 DUF2987 domain-containing protein [Oceanimonas sp. CAM02]